MEILFATPDLEAAAKSQDVLAQKFGGHVRRACQRFFELDSLATLAAAAALPTLRLTQEPGKLRYSVFVTSTHRITFEAVLRPGANLSVDHNSVTTIRILALGKTL